ncbi:MAG: VWA domain-containing protein [Muribaculaceae bacterium]
MFSFANPEYLYLLILLPLVVLLFLWERMTRKRRLNKYGKMSTIGQLMPEASKYKPWIKLTLWLLTLAMIIIVLARPRAGAKTATTKVRGIEVMIALDVSNSMRASSTDDPSGVSRLQRSKLILEKLIDRLGDDKVGLIVFAGNAYTQLPITSDFMSAKMFLNSINTNMVPTQGTAIGAAINLAMKSFSQNEKSGKSIIIITDGENHEDDAIGAAKEAHKRGIQINVIGVGSTKGAPIPMGGTGNFLKDDSGQVVTTYLNEQMAIDIAKAAKGVYVSGNSSDAVGDVDENLKKLASEDLEKVVYTQHDEQFPVFAWIALVLILINIFVVDRKNRWLSKYNFFTNKNVVK